jgi:hypothetical protein
LATARLIEPNESKYAGVNDLMLRQAVILLSCCLVAPPAAMAQSQSLSATMNVHVFPREGQDQVQQSMDEAECYGWAADRTGNDPFELARQAEEQAAATDQAMAQAQSAGQGSTGRGAARGAVAGGLIGGVFGNRRNSGWKGAAVGAATGAVVGNAHKRGAQEEATQEVAAQSAQAQAANQAQMDDFRTAFSTCLEAKDYIARF